MLFSIADVVDLRFESPGQTHAALFCQATQKASGGRGLRQPLVPLKIETDGKQGLLSHLSSLTRLRRRSTSANDSERSGAIRTRVETAREKGRANRGSVHVSERPLLSWKDCVCDR